MADAPFYLQRADLPSAVLFSDVVNVLDHELHLKHVAEPDSPDEGYSILFPDLADSKLKIKKSTGEILSLEDILTAIDTKVTIKEGGAVKGTSALNFSIDTDFDITYSGIDGETTIKIADNAIGDAHIAEHTSSKISIADISQLPSVAPNDAPYIVSDLHAGLSAERVITGGSNVTIDNSVAGVCTINASLAGGAGSDLSNFFKLSGIISPAQITADENNYNPTGLGTCNGMRINANAARNITGLTALDNQVILVHNVGSFPITLKDESTSSTAANRFALNGDLILQTDHSVILWYDPDSDRWRAAGQFTGGGGSTTSLNVLDRVTTANTVGNTSSEATLYSFSLSAGVIGLNGILRLYLAGDYINDSGSSDSFDIKVKLGSTVIFQDNTGGMSTSSTRRPWKMEVWINNRNSEASQAITGEFSMGNNSAGVVGLSDFGTSSISTYSPVSNLSSINTASTQTLSVTIDHSDSDPLISIRTHLIVLEKL